MLWAILPCITATSFWFALALNIICSCNHSVRIFILTLRNEETQAQVKPYRESQNSISEIWDFFFFFSNSALRHSAQDSLFKMRCVCELDTLDFLHTREHILTYCSQLDREHLCVLVLHVHQNHITPKYKAASLVMWWGLSSWWHSAADLTMESEECHVQLRWQRKIEYAGCLAGTSRNVSMRVIGNIRIYCWTSVLTFELHHSE